MSIISSTPKILLLSALLAGTASAGMAAQSQDAADANPQITVTGAPVAEPVVMTAGPKIEGIISARKGDTVQVTTADGTKTVIAVNDATQIKASGGFLGLDRNKLATESLLNGLPVTIKTMQAGDSLVASEISLKNRDMKTATMIHNATDQRFTEQTAATDALRSRVGDIDQYNVKSTTNVNFDIGKAKLSEQAKNDLCSTVSAAEGMENSLLLVVGYTDSTGSVELNQELSEKRATQVVRHIQQVCGWKPYRMLTPTGMAEADPLATNDTIDGKAQNRRVAVNVLVSKSVDGL